MENTYLEELEGATNRQEAFKIDTKDKAAWALRKIVQLKKGIAENAEVAKIEIARIQQWFEKESEKDKGSIAFFESLLREYFFAELQKDEKLKTIKLPHGSLQLRTQQPEYSYDEDIIVEWAKKFQPDIVIHKEINTVDKNKLKEYLKEAADTGEVVPGVLITQRPAMFKVTTAE